MLGKPVEVLSFEQGPDGLTRYLSDNEALPLRNYVPLQPGTVVEEREPDCCLGRIQRFEADDDINYTLLALLNLEQNGAEFTREDIARLWLNRMPGGVSWTAERAAYRCLMDNMDPEFVNGGDAGFDLDACSAHEFSDWIGAQIRADLYGWVNPGSPGRAADMARRDASLSHRADGIESAAFIAALAASVPVSEDFRSAIERAASEIDASSAVHESISIGLRVGGRADGPLKILRHYDGMNPVHALNNLAIITWALTTHGDDFSAAVGETVSAGLDTDSNGATVGGLCGLAGLAIDEKWTRPWAGRVSFSLAGVDELHVEALARRTLAVMQSL